MGFGKLTERCIGKINIPLFHVAGIKKMPLKGVYFNKLHNFQKVQLRSCSFSNFKSRAIPLIDLAVPKNEQEEVIKLG